MIRGQESIQRADDKSFLIDFETEVKEIYESGKITSPVHLSGGNENELIKIFEDVDEDDKNQVEDEDLKNRANDVDEDDKVENENKS